MFDRNEGLTGIIVIFLLVASQGALASIVDVGGGGICLAMASLRNPASLASYSTTHQLSWTYRKRI